MKLLIVVHHRLELWNVPAWFKDRLEKQFPQVQIVLRNGYEGIEEHLRDAEIIFTLSLRPEQIAVTRNLRWIHTPSAAVHQFLFPELVNSQVVVTNSGEVHGPVVAEHVMALIFALARRFRRRSFCSRSASGVRRKFATPVPVKLPVRPWD